MKQLLALVLAVAGISVAQTPAAYPGSYQVVNDTSTGTTFQKLAKLSSGKAILAGTSDTTSIGVCVQTCTTSGSALIAFSGIVGIIQDGNTTLDHWVVESTSVAGDIHDTGSTTYPTTGIAVGQVVQANAGGAGVVAQIQLNQNFLTAVSSGTALTSIFFPFGASSQSAISQPLSGTHKVQVLRFSVPSPGWSLTGGATVFTTNAGDAGHFAFAIYDTGGTLVTNSQTATVTGIGAQSVHKAAWAGTVALTPGDYYFSMTSDSASTGFFSLGDVSALTGNIMNTASSSGFGECANSSTGTTTITHPGTCGGITNYSPGGFPQVPLFALN